MSRFERPVPAARREVLDTLRALYPRGISSPDLIEKHGPAAKSRVGELRADGWRIESEQVGGVALYRLESLQRGTPRSALPSLKVIGTEVQMYSEHRGTFAPEVEARLVGRIKTAMEEALATLAPPEPTEDDRVAAIVDAMEELYDQVHGLAQAVRRSRR